jgi:spore maturation protein A
MIIIAIIVGLLTGHMSEITQAFINSSKDAVELAFMMLGIVSAWTGIMNIAQKAGIIEDLSKKMRPILRFLFPSIPDDHKANKYIATNIIANMLGLGWAATPAGLMAMKELQKLNKQKDVASDAMCMFLIINISSIQLISVNIIAYRLKYGAVNATDIVLPTLIATSISTLIGILYAKNCESR